jgi:hypothetical protein
MQEKLCSRNVEYLVPIASCDMTSIPAKHLNLVIGNDLAVNVQESVANFNLMTSPEPGLLTAFQPVGKWVRTSESPDELARNIELTLTRWDRAVTLSSRIDQPYLPTYVISVLH